MACLEGPRAKQWGNVKKRFRALFDNRPGFDPVPTDELVDAVKGAIADIEAVGGFSQAPDAANECGFGKLFVQLLTLTTIDDPTTLAQYFQEHPATASPVLTMLLDIPWVTMAQSGWPFFGIMAHFAAHKVRLLDGVLNQAAIDGLQNDVVKAFFDAMSESKKDIVAMATASHMYLRSPIPDSPYATLTALAATSAVEMNLQQRLEAIQALQNGMKQAVTTPQELDISLTIRWPLWAFLHASVDVFADA